MAPRLADFEFSAAKPKKQIPITGADVDEPGRGFAKLFGLKISSLGPRHVRGKCE